MDGHAHRNEGGTTRGGSSHRKMHGEPVARIAGIKPSSHLSALCIERLVKVNAQADASTWSRFANVLGRSSKAGDQHRPPSLIALFINHTGDLK